MEYPFILKLILSQRILVTFTLYLKLNEKMGEKESQ